MTVDQRRIAVLGAGRIGEALISGLLSSGWRAPEDITASTRRPERVTELAERYGIEVTASNVEAAGGAALVVVAVKPQDIDALLGEIGTAITPEQTVLTVAAATPTTTIERHLAAGVPVVRAMPNTPSTVHEGVAGLCAGAHAGDAHVTLAEEALAHLGSVVRVPERYMDAVTAVSGSGPAYFALLAEAMIEAGLLLGLSREISTQLVIQMLHRPSSSSIRPTSPSLNASGYVRTIVMRTESRNTTTASAVRREVMCAYGSMTRRR